MAIMIQREGGAETRTLGVNRSAAVAAVVDQRKASAVPPIETSGRPAAPSEPAATPAPESPSADKPPMSPSADPAHQVEIERRERQIDAARHEAELNKRELESLRAQLKDPDAALRAAGMSPDDYIARYLGQDPAAAAAAAGAPPAPENEWQRRVEQLEAERAQERAAARARTRRQEIESLMPEGSEDYEITRALGEFGSIDQFMHEFDALERSRAGGIGPEERKQLLSNFEGASRKNVQAQLTRLAKTKYGRSMITELLKLGSETVQAPPTGAETAPLASTREPARHEHPSMSLSGRERENLRERVKAEFRKRRGL